MARVLITGATGPVGSSLAEYLLRQPDVELAVFRRWRSDPRALSLGGDRRHREQATGSATSQTAGTVMSRNMSVPFREGHGKPT